MYQSNLLADLKLDPNELAIDEYRQLYVRNQKVNKSSLVNLIASYEVLKKGSVPVLSSKESELSSLNMRAREILTDEQTRASFRLVTKEYLQKQAEKSFDLRNPRRKLNEPVADAFNEMLRAQKKARECKITDELLFQKKITYQLKFLINLYKCLNDFGLKSDLINQRGDKSDYYNIAIKFIDKKGKDKKDAVILLKNEELIEQYVQPYNSKHAIMFNGILIPHPNIHSITISVAKYSLQEAKLFLQKRGHNFYENKSSSRIRYTNECKIVTDKFINTKNSVLTSTQGDYVFKERLEELNSISTSKYDLKKLIRLCNELNLAHKYDLRYAKAALVRAICDHIPPIFDFDTFAEVTANHHAEGNSKSFKGGMKRLHEFFKHVADGVMHSHIRSKESLPTKDQLDYSRELDFLLQEVCRLLR